jgi:hypothetical protein
LTNFASAESNTDWKLSTIQDFPFSFSSEVEMKKVIVAAALSVVAASALAAFFFSADASVGSNGALTVAFDERGLGNADVSYTLTASGTAVYACINGGGNHPQSTNKMGPSPISASLTNVKVKNGRVVSSITVEPPGPGSFSCPSGQSSVLACVSYTDVLLTDTTNNLEVVPTGTTSRTFISAKGISCA